MDNKSLRINITGVRDSYELVLVNGKEALDIESKLLAYNKIISDERLLHERWNEYVQMRYYSYIYLWSPISFIGNRYFSAICRKCKLFFASKRGFKYYLNLMKCESHSDLSKEIIRKFLIK